MTRQSSALIVYGPTASGKSALALALARRFGGAVINADSMQVYRELRILTARPTAEEEAAAPHFLYGVRPASEPANAAWWRGAALAAMAEARARNLVPILCGGTGLYLVALTHGLAEIPEPGAAARTEARALLKEIGPEALHARLVSADPETAARLRPSDSQRIARAWEVWRGTGSGLAAWQLQPAQPPADWRFLAITLDPPRPALRAAIAARFGRMLEQGAVEEVRALLALGLDPALPALRAHGVPELAAYLAGTATLEDAARRAILATGRYVRRQATWLRHQTLTPGSEPITIRSRFETSAQFQKSIGPEIGDFLLASG